MLPMPSLRGRIDRRILVNYRIDPDTLDGVLPTGFRPRTVCAGGEEFAIGGICCLRLTAMRLRGLPAVVGTTSENAAHRIGVEWDEDGETRSGVYVPRRDTSSRLASAVGSRAYGRQYRADFEVEEGDDRYEFSMRSRDGEVALSVVARETDELPADSAFDSVAAASTYHECGGVGYCPSPSGDRLDGVELATDEWGVTPLAVESVRASFFEDALPAGTATFDNALLMTDVGHEWRSIPARPAAEGASG